MVDSLVGWFVGWLCWLVGWLVGGLVGWLVGWFAGHLAFSRTKVVKNVGYVMGKEVGICLYFVLFCFKVEILGSMFLRGDLGHRNLAG